jgi:DnaJ like chaperone protein
MLLEMLIFSESWMTLVIVIIVVASATALFLRIRRRRRVWERWKQQNRRTRGTMQTANEQSRPWWQVLEISERSTLEEVKAAYRAKIKQYHPDSVAGLAREFQELADSKTKEIIRAYRQACRTRRSGRTGDTPRAEQAAASVQMKL